MSYIDQWLTGLGLEYVIPKLKSQGITTPKKLALLSLRDMYEVVGVEDAFTPTIALPPTDMATARTMSLRSVGASFARVFRPAIF